MRAVQIGAGNIGRGFLGQLYYESGCETTFVDANRELVDLLNRRGEYAIEVVEPFSVIRVEGFRAVEAGTRQAAQAIAEADIASTAVGANVLPKIVPMLLEGLAKREQPLDLLLAENLHDAARRMRDSVDSACGFSLGRLGLVETSIGRMVPLMTEEERSEDPLRIRVEAFCELPVDADAFLNPIPPIKGLQPKSNFPAYVDRKLYLHNAGHAAAAYLGYLAGHRSIWQAMEDPITAEAVRLVMDECCQGLHRRHGLDLGELSKHAEDLRRRFSSRALGDTVRRVAADPIRKLGFEDRLIGSLRMCLEQDVEPTAVAKACGAAYLYRDASDPAANELASMVARLGFSQAIQRISGLEPGSRPHQMILKAIESTVNSTR